MHLLALETATEACSAALWVDGQLLWEIEPAATRRHGELILVQVDRLLATAGLVPAQLDAVAVSRGPGAFTGVRLGMGVAQGLAFAVDCPIVPVSTLAALAQQGAACGRGVGLIALLDARMGEVYWSCLGLAEREAIPGADEQSETRDRAESKKELGIKEEPEIKKGPETKEWAESNERAVSEKGPGIKNGMGAEVGLEGKGTLEVDERMNVKEILELNGKLGVNERLKVNEVLRMEVSPEVERLTAPTEVRPDPRWQNYALLGSGLLAYPEIARNFVPDSLLVVNPRAQPRALEVAQLGVAALLRGEGVSAELALPVYLREHVAVPAARPAGLPIPMAKHQ